jgi:hypothetical protein
MKITNYEVLLYQISPGCHSLLFQHEGLLPPSNTEVQGCSKECPDLIVSHSIVVQE